MARNKQIDVDGDESESGSYGGSEPKRKKGKGYSSANRTNTKGHSNGNPRGAESAATLDLGVYTDAANMVIQSMSATQNAMKDLAQLYTTQVQRIEQINETQERYDRLVKQCRDKDEKINNQDITIKTLWETTRNQEREIEEEMKSLEVERRELEEDKKKIEKDKINATKRFKAQEAELEIKLQEALKSCKTELEKEFKDRGKELERGIQEREDKNKSRLANLEADNIALEKESKKYEAELIKAKGDYDDMKRVKESHQAEAGKLEERVKKMENEFGLNIQTAEF